MSFMLTSSTQANPEYTLQGQKFVILASYCGNQGTRDSQAL